MLPYTAYLRVYEPLEAFPEPERSRWEARPGDSESAGRLEHAGHADPGRPGPLPPAGGAEMRRPPVYDSQSAYVRHFSGEVYICPWRRRLRSWEAFSAVRGASLVPEAPADPHIRESNWHVPFPWFVPFVREERTLELGGTGASPRRSLTYLTTMARARRRLTRAAVAGERAMTDVSPFGDAQSLQEELSAFHPRSLVELDYGGLVHLVDDDTLNADDSVGECAVALVALERDELELAVAMQLRLRTRWRAIRSLQSAN
ncbi:hypothetical protein [Actinocorallia populi]|uniref:hypothetical protein n=1 Tax=Actinocorallia populi TaxID=2079200 RepID=UPI000D089E78|nr:hypothetical protein [Actinocorallia populi]